MQQGTFITRSALISFAVRAHISSKVKKMASKVRILPQMQRLLVNTGFIRHSECVSYAALATRSRQHEHPKAGKGHLHHQQLPSRQSSSGGGWGDRDEDRRHRFPVKLMDFPEKTVPDIVKSFRNRFFSFLIKGYYDTTFTIDGFLEGAVQAVSSVSSYVSDGNFADLKGLVADEAVPEIQNNYADLTYQQRRWLKVKPSEVIGKFVYEIGMMFDDDTDQRFVEITVVLHGCHNLEDNPPSSLSDLYGHMGENPDNFYVCNYRFIREFTKGVEDSWTINKLNHFLPFEPPTD
ncbi:hypothetical protein ACOMHN_040227 [Nucella lapillus]